jgi:hypothetical protein
MGVKEVIMAKIFRELVFGLSRGFGIYFSQRNDFIEPVMTPALASKNRR